mmetsp:Transcript_15380/g.33085  ORF Transcript_15380/g.33085 Transcript_15380/m.33085 type:complete len:216 (+) Transcript_15380:112-759(+)
MRLVNILIATLGLVVAIGVAAIATVDTGIQDHVPARSVKRRTVRRNKPPRSVVKGFEYVLPCERHSVIILDESKFGKLAYENETVREAVSITPLGGGLAQGSYYAEVALGGQVFNALVDTGSYMLAVPTVQCTTCSETTTRYSTEGRDTLVHCSDADFCVESDSCPGQFCESCSASGACCVFGDFCFFDSDWKADGSRAFGLMVRDTFELGATGL